MNVVGEKQLWWGGVFVSLLHQCATFNHVCKFIYVHLALDIATTRLILRIIRTKGTPEVHHKKINKDMETNHHNEGNF